MQTVFFDLDGTLLDTEPDFTVILNQLLETYGVQPISSAEVRATVSSGARALVKLGFNIDEQHEYFSKYLTELLNLYQDIIAQSQACLFEDIETLLTTLSESSIRWGIVTNKPSRFTLPLLKNFDSFNPCATVICPDQLTRSKPDPEGLLLACQNLQCSPQDCIYVGDHPRDIEAARNAGMHSVAVSWGYIPHEHPIEQWRADTIISKPLDLLSFLEKNRA